MPKLDKTERNLIAEEIVEQCGGTAMMRMIGVTSIVHGENSAIIKFSCKALYGINCIEVFLDPNDTYTVRFWKIKGTHTHLHYSAEGIYADQLVSLIEAKTGLSLKMPYVYHHKTGRAL